MSGRKAFVFFLVPVFFFSGCASIVGRDVFPLTINSNPEGANIVVVDERGKKMFSGTTPSTVTLAAGESYFHPKVYTVTFSQEGYAERTATVRATLSGWYFGNILFGGLIGMLIVDPITGKMWKLPSEVAGNLTQKLAGREGPPTLKVVTLSQVPDPLRKSLVSLD